MSAFMAVRCTASVVLLLAAAGCAVRPATATTVPDLTGASDAQLQQYIGRRVAVHGTFSLLGKAGPYVLADGRPVYFLSSGPSSWGERYTRWEGHDVRVTGVLRFAHYPESPPASGPIDRPADCFYFEAASASISRLASRSASGLMKLVGTRDFSVGQAWLRIPWYRLDVDYHATDTAAFWKRVKAPAGTKTTYVGRYGEIEWCEWHDDESHDMRRAKGLSFIVPDTYRVAPGPGAVHIRWWLYEEQTPGATMSFREDRYYVFCLDRRPVQQWLNGAKEPSCDMGTELSHLRAIIEISPTFDFGPRPASSPLYLTRDNLLSYREERYNGLSSSYELEYAVTRKEDGRFECQTPQGRGNAKPEVAQKLLYALNTCTWEQEKQPHRFNDSAVVRTLIEYLDDAGARRTAIIEYDGGGWYLQSPERQYYSTIFPYLLYEVERDVATACSPEARGEMR